MTPKIPNDKNQSNVIGPKNLPTNAVPCFCIKNNVVTITIAIGTINGSSTLVAIDRPSTAESTEIAGVIIPSPKNSDAPTKPIAIK
jgi:hypothetical protein